MSKQPRKLLGEILQRAELITPEQLEDALRYQKETGLKLGECLINLSHCRADDVCRGLARQAGMPFVDVRKGTIPEEVIATIPRETAAEHNIIPVKIQGPGKVVLAVTDPLAVYNLEHLRFILNLEFTCALTTEEAMIEAFKRYYGVEKRGAATVGETARRAGGSEVSADDAPIIRLVNTIFEDAIRSAPRDIHVEPMRGPGARPLPRRRRAARVVAELPEAPAGADPLAPQDHGRAWTSPRSASRRTAASRPAGRGREIDIRVSVAARATTARRMVMRLLDKEAGLVSLEALGFAGDDHARFQRIIKRPNGIFLVTGPDRLGQDHDALRGAAGAQPPDVKIITAEDPVEYHIAGINQCQVRHQIGLDFARILRAMLRQAPNIILVGEIRDHETAEIAIQAALTGHLVFSTLHTNDAPSALTRLIDMGVKPFLVAPSVQAVMAQRLVRVLCPRCREVHEPGRAELRALGLDPGAAQRAARSTGRGAATPARAPATAAASASSSCWRWTTDAARDDLPRRIDGAPARATPPASGGMRHAARGRRCARSWPATTTIDEVLRVCSPAVIGTDRLHEPRSARPDLEHAHDDIHLDADLHRARALPTCTSRSAAARAARRRHAGRDLRGRPLTPEDTEAHGRGDHSRERNRAGALEKRGTTDFGHALRRQGRFRVSVFRQKRPARLRPAPDPAQAADASSRSACRSRCRSCSTAPAAWCW